jgi:hypothetical protein
LDRERERFLGSMMSQEFQRKFVACLAATGRGKQGPKSKYGPGSWAGREREKAGSKENI